MLHTVQCPSCGLCYQECRLQADAIRQTSTGVTIDLDACNRCGHCAAVCPTGNMEMACLRDAFVYDSSSITDDLVEMRYRASTRPGFHERFAALFPAPRQRWVDAMAPTPEELATLEIPTLLVHGRDDRVIPASSSEQLARRIPNARLEIIPECGHWVQIEKTDTFVDLVSEFLGAAS